MNAPEMKQLSKFLRCNDVQPEKPWNKFLVHPYRRGEVVKVAPLEEQKSSTNLSQQEFRHRFVKVYRKDNENNYTIPYVAGWEIFELLTTPLKPQIQRRESQSNYKLVRL